MSNGGGGSSPRRVRPSSTRRSSWAMLPVKIMNKFWDASVDGLRDLNMKPGQEVELEVIFPESARGDWEIGCFRPGHYDAGMRVPFIVE